MGNEPARAENFLCFASWGRSNWVAQINETKLVTQALYVGLGLTEKVRGVTEMEDAAGGNEATVEDRDEEMLDGYGGGCERASRN